MDILFCGKCGGHVENGVCTQCGAQFPPRDKQTTDQNAQSQPAAQPQTAAAQPQPAAAQPQSAAAQPQFVGAQPQYAGAQPQYAGAQPQFVGAQSQFVGAQPQFAGGQPQFVNQMNNGFVEPDEQVIATIGNSFTQNFFASGFMATTGAVLTNKRLYYTGKAISVGSSLLQKNKSIIELSEITGVEICHKDKLPISIFFAVLFQLLAIIFFNYLDIIWLGVTFEIFVLIAVILGILSIKNVLCVVFKGGYLTFPINLYGFGPCAEFLRQILLARKAFLNRN